MKITINDNEYDTIKNLSFSPQTDITGSKVAINGFAADIVTDDLPSTGDYAYLYDDVDNLWARYKIIESHKLDENLIRIETESVLRALNKRRKKAVMYSDEPVEDAIAALFKSSSSYILDSSFNGKVISGYCPKQTARERLQWICFCIGAYVKTFFAEKIEILPVDNTEVIIPANKTYWKPEVTYDDYVTSVSATAYTYTQGTPQTTDTWVKVGGVTYIVTEQEFTLDNPSAPASANENVVSVDNVTIINQDNVSDILSLLSTYYFKRITVDAEIINNAEYVPGDKVTVSTDEDTLITGFIDSMDFSFGLQAKARIHISQTDLTSGAKLVIVRKYNDTTLRKDRYNFPLGYEYSIENPYLDITKNSIRRVYRPVNQYASGTMSSAKVTDNQSYEIALQFSSSKLKIISVDDVDVQTSTDDKIGVIA